MPAAHVSEYIRRFQNAFDSDRNDSDWLEGRADLLQSARRHRGDRREWACSSYIIRHDADKRKFTLATRLARPAARMGDLNLRNLWLLVF
jgi:hypothetical protein